MVQQLELSASRRIVYREAAATPTGGVEVKRVASEVDLQAYGKLQAEVWGAPLFSGPEMQTAYRNMLKRSDVTLYLALVEGEPAGSAFMLVDDGVGYMASAATLEAFRGRGCQNALLGARLTDAAECGCDLVMSLVTEGSASERNMIRNGFKTAYDRIIWMPEDWRSCAFYGQH
jgi:GNAT superfamily N-acetyltransferase